MGTYIHASNTQCTLNRRGFLRGTAAGITGLTGILALGQPLAAAQERELTMLSFNIFVPQPDEQLRRKAALFSQKHLMKATDDTIAGPQMPQKLAVEVEIHAVHGVVVLPHSSPYLYQHQLVTVDPLAEELGKRDEGWHDFCRDHSCVDGEWKVVGCWNSSGAN